MQFDETIVASEVGSYKPAHRALAGVLRGTDADRMPARPRRREPLPRHRPGERARPADASGSTGSARARRPAADARDSRSRAAWRTCWTSSSRREVRVPLRRGEERRARPSPTSCNAFERAVAAEPEIVSAADGLRFWRDARARRAARRSTDGTLVGFAFVQRPGRTLRRRRLRPPGRARARAWERRSSIGSRAARRESSDRRRCGSASSASDERAACAPPAAWATSRSAASIAW